MGKKLFGLIKNNLLSNNVDIHFKDEICNIYDYFDDGQELEIARLNVNNVVGVIENKNSLCWLFYLLYNDITFILSNDKEQGVVNDIINVGNMQENNICIMTTSGSTGKPKMIAFDEDTLICNMSDFAKKTGNIKSYGIFLSTTYSYGFNCLITALMKGCSVYLADASRLNDVFYFFDFINNEKIDGLFCPVNILNFISQKNIYHNIKRRNISIAFGGDIASLSSGFIAYCAENNIKLYNLYGNTETGIALISEVKSFSDQNIFNVNNCIFPYSVNWNYTKVKKQLILNIDSQYSGFNNLSNGQPIFFKDVDVDIKSFLTGDNIDDYDNNSFLITGRIDDIIKINSHRISTKQIESYLLNIDGVEDCAVYSVKSQNQGELLVATIISDESNTYEIIRSRLEERLPEYMIPILLFSDSIPVNANGKKDRKLLATNYMHSSFSENSIFHLIEKVLNFECLLDDDSALMNHSLNLLGLDSLNIVFLLSSLETKYSINLDEILINGDITLKNIINHLKGNSNG